MDTYLTINSNCITCGDCIDACEFEGQNYLTMIYRYCDFDGIYNHECMVQGAYDYVPCHHCDGFRENKTPCQITCKQNAITLERW